MKIIRYTFPLFIFILISNSFANAQCSGFTEQIGVVTIDWSFKRYVIAWDRTQNQSINSYRVERETSTPGNFEEIGAVDFADYSYVIDSDVNINDIHTYRLITIDNCGNEYVSQPHTTMTFQSSQDYLGNVFLSWSEYYGAPFSEYNIYKAAADSTGAVLVTSVPSSYTSYQISDISSEGNVFYICVAIEPQVSPVILKAEVGPYSCAKTVYSPVYYKDGIEPISTNVSNIENTLFTVYPNPATDFLLIQINEPSCINYNCSIINSIGIVVSETVLIDKKTCINIELLPKGFYSIVLNSGENTYTECFIK